MFTTLGPSLSATDLAGLARATPFSVAGRVATVPPVVTAVALLAVVVPVPAVVVVLAGAVVVVPPPMTTVHPARAKASTTITITAASDAIAVVRIRFLASWLSEPIPLGLIIQCLPGDSSSNSLL
jgi:hypothetical protein